MMKWFVTVGIGKRVIQMDINTIKYEYRKGIKDYFCCHRSDIAMCIIILVYYALNRYTAVKLPT